MAKLSAKEFMEKAKLMVGDRTDDDALSFLEDVKDTITDEKDDWKTKYETVLKEKDELDETWRKKYRDTFYSSDANTNNNENNNNNNDIGSLLDNRSEEEKRAQEITVDDLFSTAE